MNPEHYGIISDIIDDFNTKYKYFSSIEDFNVFINDENEIKLDKLLITITFKKLKDIQNFIKKNFNQKDIKPYKRSKCKKFYIKKIKIEKIWSVDEIKSEKPYLGRANNDYWHIPCYEDKNDPNTLQYHCIFYYHKYKKYSKYLKKKQKDCEKFIDELCKN